MRISKFKTLHIRAITAFSKRNIFTPNLPDTIDCTFTSLVYSTLYKQCLMFISIVPGRNRNSYASELVGRISWKKEKALIMMYAKRWLSLIARDKLLDGRFMYAVLNFTAPR
ncbi:hypothetical protein NPIL_562851 [Nephila pilipes]|uniref:Uncharacterized protein n=1 Tax=Nephila pilipes TaxID=299642 RepID=A0A8X6QM57_NEPPI|nr:hypothetical protein NPIL_562851 [Nephila pilipes]